MIPLLANTFFCKGRFHREQLDCDATFCWSNASAGELEKAGTEFLSPAETAHWEKLAPARRAKFLLGRYTAKWALLSAGQEKVQAVSVLPGVFDQPVVRGPDRLDLEVGISHTGNWAIAFACDAGHPIGIDIERLDAERQRTIEARLTPSERALLRQVGASSGSHFCVWAAKEAAGKALRVGLMADFSIYELAGIVQHGRGIVGEFSKLHQYRYLAAVGGNMALALVLPRRSELSGQLANLMDEFCRSVAWAD